MSRPEKLVDYQKFALFDVPPVITAANDFAGFLEVVLADGSELSRAHLYKVDEERPGEWFPKISNLFARRVTPTRRRHWRRVHAFVDLDREIFPSAQ